MKHLRRYNESELWTGIQHEYSIYDWFEDLKAWEWKQISSVNTGSLKTWTDHFIGEGYYSIIENHVNKIFNSLSKVDVNYISDRMTDIFDDYQSKRNHVSKVVLYGDMEKSKEPNRGKFTGAIYVGGEYDKQRIIIHIIKEIITPTLFIGFPSVNLRMTKDEKFVTNKKYQCSKFKMSNYSLYNSVIKNYINSPKVSTFDMAQLEKKYNIDNSINLHQPGVYITVGENGKTFINLKTIEKQIDEILPSILHDLDYEEVLFDMSRHDRKFDDDTEIADYTLKILLKI